MDSEQIHKGFIALQEETTEIRNQLGRVESQCGALEPFGIPDQWYGGGHMADNVRLRVAIAAHDWLTLKEVAQTAIKLWFSEPIHAHILHELFPPDFRAIDSTLQTTPVAMSASQLKKQLTYLVRRLDQFNIALSGTLERLPSLMMAAEKVTAPERSTSNPFDFFISYASEDRDLAEALDVTLSQHGYRVWRDKGQLTLGDTLTEKISEGLIASRHAIVILSKAFLRKNWPRAELNALQARAIGKGQKVILPVRRDIDHEEMAKYFPLLGDKLTVSFDNNLGALVAEIEHVLNQST